MNALHSAERPQGASALPVTPYARCPGYARGLAFHGDDALVGISRVRQNRTFAGLALDAALEAKGAEART
ncbi:MAG: DUF4915 domain-containing protein, partial [Gammaproteobacteria bacterium]